MHHRTVKNGQRNATYFISSTVKYGALIMILLLKVTSESNNNRSGVFSKGFYRKCLDFYQKTRLRIRNTDNTRQELYFL